MAKRAFVISIILALFLSVSGQVASADPGVSQAYPVVANAKLEPGDLVSTAGNGTAVAIANTENGSRLFGVVVAPGAASLALGMDSAVATVQVTQSGSAEVYVTTLGGDIRAGDAISVSPIDGFGMKAAQSLRVVGVAQADLSSKTPGVRPLSVRDRSGRLHAAYMGAVPVAIGLSSGLTAVQPGVVGGLQSLATVVAGHQVSALQAVLSFIIVVISAGSLMALIYGAIH
ncbi:MAG: hypothetical protein ACREBW_07115, partial [Candidatus Micrarchaeaceae archaeon]